MTRVAAPGRAQGSLGGVRWVRALQSYFFQSSRPLTSLVFLAVPLALYEAGTYWLAASDHPEVLAFSYLRGFLSYFGASARYLPALAVVGVLLAWHVALGDTWEIRLGVATGMAGESFLMAIPLLLLSLLMGKYLPLAAADSGLSHGIVLSLGAGIYEELVFRLIGMTLLNVLLVDLLRIGQRWALPLMVVLSAIAFSAYHYRGSAAPPLQWPAFAFRTVAGAYFSILFVHRGFGVTAGTHAAYDIYCLTLMAFRPV
jgi:hypothetical protein